MSLFTPYQRPVAITTSTTAAVTNDLYKATLTAAADLTLYTANGNYAGFASAQLRQGGVLVAKNESTSSAILTVVPASGEFIIGPTLVSPGQIVRYESDGVDTWYAFGVGTATGASSQTVQVPLTAAQILGMNATPVAIVPAPGSAKIVIVHNLVFKMVRTSTQFASGGAVEFRYTNGSGAKVSADASASLVTGAAGTAYSAIAGVVTELTPVANAAIVITNATGAFTTGTGTGVVTVKYSIITP